jgi:hypothetical protein
VVWIEPRASSSWDLMLKTNLITKKGLKE